MTVVEFIGGPWCGRIMAVEYARTEFRVAKSPYIYATAAPTIPPEHTLQHYVYRACRRRRDDQMCYWYVGIR